MFTLMANSVAWMTSSRSSKYPHYFASGGDCRSSTPVHASGSTLTLLFGEADSNDCALLDIRVWVSSFHALAVTINRNNYITANPVSKNEESSTEYAQWANEILNLLRIHKWSYRKCRGTGECNIWKYMYASTLYYATQWNREKWELYMNWQKHFRSHIL